MKIIDVEQGVYEWHIERQGRVTGTRTKSALGTAKVQQTLLYQLVAERMTEPQIDDLNASAVVRGNELEPFARKAVIAETGIEFTETGMLVSDVMPMFALSPDAIFSVEGVVVGGLEIKCPSSKKHVEYMIADEVPQEYFEQVKAPFLLDDSVKWWMFASFDDRNYERPLFITTVTREDIKTIDDDRAKLGNFLDLVDATHSELTF